MSTIVICGAGGGVGASVAFNLLVSPLDCEIVMVDARWHMLRSHLWDLEQVLEQGATGTLREGDQTDVATADVLVVCAAAPLTVNQSRMVYLHDNAAIVAPLLARLPADWNGVAIVVTNPVDPLCTWAQRRLGLARERLLGYTLNDSLRLRTGVGRLLGAAPGAVSAWTIGEHGDLAVPLWDRVEVDGRPVELTEEQVLQVEAFIGGWYQRHVALDSGRSSTWTSGLGVARMVRACLGDGEGDGEGRGDGDGGEQLWPASVMLTGEYGLNNVSLSVPVTLGAGGMQAIQEWELSVFQQQALEAGAMAVRAAADDLAQELD